MKEFSKEKELIKRMLSGELSQEEQLQVNRMMKQSWFAALFHKTLDEQGGELEMVNDEWSNTLANQQLRQFHQQIQTEGTPVVSMRKPLWKRALPYAAAVVVAAGALMFWYGGNNDSQPPALANLQGNKSEYAAPVVKQVDYTAHSNTGKRRMKLKLADGSVVTLGAKGRIRYPKGFAGDKRDVYLEGEAFFEVKKDARKPFTVYTGDIHTEVLGTSFKVSAMPEAAIEVAVVTGKVRVSHHAGNRGDNLITMTPGDKISWENAQLTKRKFDTGEILAWKNEMMVFKKKDLQNILDVFRKHYGVKITVINKGFLTEKISLTLDERMPIEKAMNVLSVTAGFDHSYDSLSRTVIIK